MMAGKKKTKKELCKGLSEEQATAARIVNGNTLRWSSAPDVDVYRLHETDILTHDKKKGTVVLNSGGWKTPITKERMNTFLGKIFGDPENHNVCGFGIVQSAGIWYISKSGYDHKTWVPFFDGIVVDKKGEVLNARPEVAEETQTLLKKIDKYMKVVRKELDGGMRIDVWPEISDHSFDRLKPPRVPFPRERLLLHMDQEYVQGTLIRDSLAAAGAGRFYVQLVSGMHKGNEDWNTIVRYVRKHVKHILGVAG